MRKPHGIPTWLSLVLCIQVLLCALVVTRQAAALPLPAQEEAQLAAALPSAAPATMLTLMSIVSRGPTVPASLVTNAPRNSEARSNSEARNGEARNGEAGEGDEDGDEAPSAQAAPPPSAAWFAGFCDPRGASGIAPLPALPVQGGSVDADDGPCSGSRLQAASNIHGNDDLPSRLAADGDALVLALPTLSLPGFQRFAERTLPRETERRWALPRGYRRAVDHPPRG